MSYLLLGMKLVLIARSTILIHLKEQCEECQYKLNFCIRQKIKCLSLKVVFSNLMNLYTEIYYPSNIRHYSRQNVVLILLWRFNLKRKTIFGGIFM